MRIQRIHKIRVLAVGGVIMLALLIACPTGAAVRTRGNTRQSGHLDEGRLGSLLDILRTQPPSLPVPSEIQQSKDREVRDEYFAARKRQFEEHEAKVNAAIEELAAMGDDVVDWLDRQYRAPIVAPQHKIITVLAMIGTPKARESLLNIAIAKYDPNRTSCSTWAARNLVRIAPEKETAIQLLKSDDPRVIDVGLQNLHGVSIDSTLLASLGRFLQSTGYNPVMNYAMREHAGLVIAKDSSSSLTGEKVRAIVDSIRSVENMPTANEKFQSDVAGTLADLMYRSLIGVLARIEDADSYLRNAREGLSGKPRLAVVIALALKGDSSVKGELCNMLQDPSVASLTNMRWHGIRALGGIGTKEDIPFLERLSKEDPLEIVDFNGPIFEMVNGRYVNTGSRMATIKVESDPAWMTARRSYPIREVATQAMQAIEKRLAN